MIFIQCSFQQFVNRNFNTKTIAAFTSSSLFFQLILLISLFEIAGNRHFPGFKFYTNSLHYA